MRVAIASSFLPFLQGGARKIADDLAHALRERGHEVERVLVPADNAGPTSVDQMLAARLLDVGDLGDRLIAIRPPAHLLRHPSKVLWLIHQARMVYDLWGTGASNVPNTAEGRLIRTATRAIDDACLGEARAIFTNSKIVGDRLRAFSGFESSVLYPPLGDDEDFPPIETGDYVLCCSRIALVKRQHLLAAAMAHVRSATRLVIAGAPDEPEDLVRVRRAIERSGRADRITLIPRWISEAEKRDLIGRSLACAYLPFEEDSYGYPTLEAFRAHKPALTTADAGGTHELVVDGVNGRIAEPTPEALAEAIDDLARDRARARAMGEAARASADAVATSWDTIVERLLA